MPRTSVLTLAKMHLSLRAWHIPYTIRQLPRDAWLIDKGVTYRWTIDHSYCLARPYYRSPWLAYENCFFLHGMKLIDLVRAHRNVRAELIPFTLSSEDIQKRLAELGIPYKTMAPCAGGLPYPPFYLWKDPFLPLEKFYEGALFHRAMALLAKCRQLRYARYAHRAIPLYPFPLPTDMPLAERIV